MSFSFPVDSIRNPILAKSFLRMRTRVRMRMYLYL